MSRHVRTCICFGDLWKRDPVVELINKCIFPKAQIKRREINLLLQSYLSCDVT